MNNLPERVTLPLYSLLAYGGFPISKKGYLHLRGTGRLGALLLKTENKRVSFYFAGRIWDLRLPNDFEVHKVSFCRYRNSLFLAWASRNKMIMLKIDRGIIHHYQYRFHSQIGDIRVKDGGFLVLCSDKAREYPSFFSMEELAITLLKQVDVYHLDFNKPQRIFALPKDAVRLAVLAPII